MKVHRIKIILIFVLIISISFTHPIAAESQNTDYVQGEVIISLKDNASISDILSVLDDYYLKCEVKDRIDNIALLSFHNNISLNTVIQHLAGISSVDTVQPNYIVSTFELTDDEYITSQWPLENTGSYISYYGGLSYNDVISSVSGIDMEVGRAWETYQSLPVSKTEVIVAIIDTGIDYRHPDLQEHLWTNPDEIPGDGIDNDNNGYIDDIYGWDFYNDDNSTCHYSYDKENNILASPKDSDNHGTHCAGIIAATANNGIGIAGIASNINVKIMTIKALGGGSSHTPGSGSVYGIIKGIKYASSMGAKVCNMSWGHSNYNPIMQQTLRQAMEESDMLFVAAAGNSGDNNDKMPLYPASYSLDNLISVTAINGDGSLSDFSNYGKKTIDVAAPGEDIFSTIVGSYSSASGTSMAAPHVTAIAAMLYSCKDNMYPINVKDIITSSVTPLKELNSYMLYPGLVSAYKALQSFDDIASDDEAPTLSIKSTFVKNEIQLKITPKDSGDSHIRTIKYMNGKKNTKDFLRGMEGTPIYNNKITVTKAGNYTFYISDYAGNETIYIYNVTADKTAPQIRASYSVSNSYKTITINVNLLDKESGIKTVKYAKGTQSADYFKSAANGTKLTVSKGSASFKISSSGKYTIYAVDYAGNKSVKTIYAIPIPSEIIKLDMKNISLAIGETYTLTSTLTPEKSTDKITYSTSSPTAATVSSKGKITGMGKGKAIITAITSSGKRYTCTVSVK